MKSNIFISCLINDYGVKLARKVASIIGYSFYNFSEAIEMPQIIGQADLNKLIKNSNLNRISADQLAIIGDLNNSVIYCDNFNLLNENNLQMLKQKCVVVYIKISKNAYLEHEWQQNLNSAARFKVNIKVFETRDKAYISCAEVVINGEDDIIKTASKLIKKLEKL